MQFAYFSLFPSHYSAPSSVYFYRLFILLQQKRSTSYTLRSHNPDKLHKIDQEQQYDASRKEILE